MSIAYIYIYTTVFLVVLMLLLVLLVLWLALFEKVNPESTEWLNENAENVCEPELLNTKHKTHSHTHTHTQERYVTFSIFWIASTLPPPPSYLLLFAHPFPLVQHDIVCFCNVKLYLSPCFHHTTLALLVYCVCVCEVLSMHDTYIFINYHCYQMHENYFESERKQLCVYNCDEGLSGRTLIFHYLLQFSAHTHTHTHIHT